MKRMKQVISWLLCPVILVGVMPVRTLAAEGDTTTSVVDAALFFSDLHTSQSDYKEDEIISVMSGVKKSGLDFSSVTSVGDAFSSNNTSYKGYTSYITEDIRTGLGECYFGSSRKNGYCILLGA